MIGEDRVVAVIPARGGSTSVSRKNVRDVGGKPLVGWSIEVARDTDAVDRTVVSTDDEEIAAVAREFGAEVSVRPAELATDDALIVETIRHLVEELRAAGERARYMAMLEPTCPFRRPRDIRACLDLLREEDLDSVATFTEAELNPHRAWRITDSQPETVITDADPWLPRQQLPEAYQLNGGVYAFVVNALPEEGPSMLFGDCGAVTMPPERSVDIDTPLDLEFARLVAARRCR